LKTVNVYQGMTGVGGGGEPLAIGCWPLAISH